MFRLNGEQQVRCPSSYLLVLLSFNRVGSQEASWRMHQIYDVSLWGELDFTLKYIYSS